MRRWLVLAGGQGLHARPYTPFYTKVIDANARDATHVLDGLLYHEPTLPRFGPAHWVSRQQPAPIRRLRPREGRTTASPRSGCALQKRASAC